MDLTDTNRISYTNTKEHTLYSAVCGKVSKIDSILDFLNRAPFAPELQPITDKWDFILKSSVEVRKQSTGYKVNPQNGRESWPAVHFTED